MIANTEGGAPRRTPNRAARPVASFRGLATADALEATLEAAQGWLLDQQRVDGHWVGELEGDTILESEYILLNAFLGREAEPICERLARTIYEDALPFGGWSIYPGGPADLSASVEAYCALKIVGVPADDPVMARAREVILELGGAQACNSFTRFNLALVGQIAYEQCPSVPPEIVLLPSWTGISLGDMSSWTRTIVVPLSIISAFRPVRALPPARGIAELFRADGTPPSHRTAEPLSWTNFFLGVDAALKRADRWLPASWRRRGLRAAHRWLLDHFEDSDGLGAIFPPMIYSIAALRCLGYADDAEPVRWCWRQLDDLILDDGDGARVQPCVSPVWDTAIATIAVADSGVPDFHPALLRAARWLMDREVRRHGDWAVRRPGLEPTGWHFQYRNGHYPDIDDSAMVLLALQRTSLADDPAVVAATRRGVDWLLAMQNRDGGWAAFDVDIDNQVLTKVPFADHNAMLDPSCADITARIIELLGRLGHGADHPAVARALEYLWRTQEPEGCWYGRWGVNYIYGTWQVLQGLRAVGSDMDHPAVRRSADWLESVQQADGGWGESPRSYDDPGWMGRGEPTASQTAWAVLGLIAAGRARSAACRRGVQYLIDTQAGDGTWHEDAFTGTGFPRVFYLKYHLYRVYFPLIALARYQEAAGRLATAPGALASRIPALPRPLDV